MLVICNGAFKSGSSWIHALVSSIMHIRAIPLAGIPGKYNLGKSPVSLISEQCLANFVSTEDIRSNNYLTKAHFFSEATLARTYPPEVIFIFIERDIGDAVVSHYFHFLAKLKVKIPFDLYYWLIGRYKAYEISLFNHRCRHYFGDEHFFTYEQMKADTPAAVQKLCCILGVEPLSGEEINSVLAETSLESMRDKAKTGKLIYYHDAGNQHAAMFRKGAVGEYAQHFGPRSLRDVQSIGRLQFSMAGRAIYRLLFTYRRALRDQKAAPGIS